MVPDGRVTSPERTWLDCAELVDLPHVVAQGDFLLRHRLCTLDDLHAMVQWGRGRRGVRPARSALPMIDPSAESPGESIMRVQLLLRGLPAPICNLNVIVDGEWIARVDMAWPDSRVILEYDGAVHLDEQQRRHDAIRRNLLQDAGWVVIVATARDLWRPDQVATLLRDALRLGRRRALL